MFESLNSSERAGKCRGCCGSQTRAPHPNGERGFTLIELMVVIVTVVILVFGLMARAAKQKAIWQRTSCISNFCFTGLAFRQWSTDHNDKYPMTLLTNRDGTSEMAGGNNVFRVFQVMSNELHNTHFVTCLSDRQKTRVYGEDFSKLTDSNVSYFVQFDADETMPSMILAGDRNLMTNGVEVATGWLTLKTANGVAFSKKMHKYAGNVGLADGSAQQVTSEAFQKLLANTGTNVNRLIVP